MKIKKGDKLTVVCSRKGTYKAVATEAFDTLKDEWYAVALDQDEPVRGLSQDWLRGDDVPCRKGMATVTRRKS